jgi:hypothetical protein
VRVLDASMTGGEVAVLSVPADVIAGTTQTAITLSFPNPIEELPALPPGLLACNVLVTELQLASPFSAHG